MVPEGWVATQIGDIAKFTSGGTPSKRNIEFWGGNKPWISGKDLKIHYLENSIDTLTDEGFKVAKKAPKGASLILVRGMTLLKDFPVGYALREVAFNQDLKALTPYENIDGLFLSFLLVNEKHKIRQLVSTAGHGTGRLDTESIQKHPVNIPPILEQKKIAQILSTWDKAITTTQQLITNSQQQKKALMQQLLTGKKRLLDDNGARFSGEWKYLTFDEVFQVSNKKSSQVKSSEFLESGSTPIVDQSQKLIAGYCNVDDIYSDVPVIVFGDHTRCIKWVDFEFCPGADGTQVLKARKNIDMKFGYYLLRNADIPNLGYSRHMRELKVKEFKASLDLKEQQKIARVLSTAEQEVDSLQQKLEHLNQEKKALMQRLLTGKRRVQIN